MNNYCVVMSTFGNREQLKDIIGIILEEKLAACIQTIDIGSHYFWEGKICDDKEVLVLFKTRLELFDLLANKLREIHPYETPEIIQIPINNGLSEYLSWIDDVTK